MSNMTRVGQIAFIVNMPPTNNQNHKLIMQGYVKGAFEQTHKYLKSQLKAVDPELILMTDPLEGSEIG